MVWCGDYLRSVDHAHDKAIADPVSFRDVPLLAT